MVILIHARMNVKMFAKWWVSVYRNQSISSLLTPGNDIYIHKEQVNIRQQITDFPNPPPDHDWPCHMSNYYQLFAPNFNNLPNHSRRFGWSWLAGARNADHPASESAFIVTKIKCKRYRGAVTWAYMLVTRIKWIYVSWYATYKSIVCMADMVENVSFI